MNIIIEFPLQVLNSYNGQDNLDETLDENIKKSEDNFGCFLISPYINQPKILPG